MGVWGQGSRASQHQSKPDGLNLNEATMVSRELSGPSRAVVAGSALDVQPCRANWIPRSGLLFHQGSCSSAVERKIANLEVRGSIPRGNSLFSDLEARKSPGGGREAWPLLLQGFHGENPVLGEL